MNQKRHTSPQRRRQNSSQQHAGQQPGVAKAPVVAFGGPHLYLLAGREKSLQRRHPWVFSGAVERIGGNPASGDTVQVCDTHGGFLAWAAYNPQSQICARVWSWQGAEKIDADFMRRKIAGALSARKDLKLNQHSNGMRLVHGESDGL